MVERRLKFEEIAPEAMEAMLGLEKYVRKSGLEESILDMVKIRVSQINGCAFCLDMHASEARQNGESEQRIYALSAWRETDFFSGRERAALEWAEALTLVSETHVPDIVYQDAIRHFTGKELVELTIAVVAINGWNRLGVAFRKIPEARADDLPVER